MTRRYLPERVSGVKYIIPIIYRSILRPLILSNYEKRARGELPDEWHWADRLAVSWGYFTDPEDGAR